MKPQTEGDKLLHGLRDLRDAEKQQVKAIPELANAATNPDLASDLAAHAQETAVHVKRVEQACRNLGVGSRGVESVEMANLLSKATLHAAQVGNSEEVDANIISTAKKVEAYEVQEYNKALQSAEALGVDEAVDILRETLDEEKHAQTQLLDLEKRLDASEDSME
jgi:ferritin-like metal-binding protein YciE